MNRTVQSAAALRQKGVLTVGDILTVHSAPDQITVVMSVDFDDRILARAVERTICEIETEVEALWPEVKRLFIRPQHGASASGIAGGEADQAGRAPSPA